MIKPNFPRPTLRKCGFRDATVVSINLHNDLLCSDSFLHWVADVGGGYVKNDERFCLARIPLRWMIRECFAIKTGIQFRSAKLKQMGIDPTSLYPKLIPRPQAISGNKREADPKHPFVSEEYEDLSDALSNMYDQLQLRPFWWILEVLPQHQQYQKDDDKWDTTVRCVMNPRVSIVLSRLLVLTPVVSPFL